MRQLPAPTYVDGASPALETRYRPPETRYRDAETIRLGDALRVMRRCWWLLAIGAVGGAGMALAYALLLVPVYESSASVRVDKKTSILPEVYRDLSPKSDLQTESEVLGSRTLATRVADSLRLRLHLTSPRRAIRRELLQFIQILPSATSGEYELVRQPDGRFRVTGDVDSGETRSAVIATGEIADLGGVQIALAPAASLHSRIALRLDDMERTVKELQKSVHIDIPNREANITEVSYRDTDPRTARDVVDLWTRTFIGDRQSVQHSEARSTAAYVRAQLDTLSAELAAAEERLASFRRREQVVSPDVQASTQVTQLAALRAQRSGIEAERKAISDLLSDIDSSAAKQGPDGPSPYRRLIGFPTIFRNQAASELLRSLADVEAQRATLLQRRTPQDPEVEVLTTRVHELEDQLRAIATTYRDGLSLQVASLDSAQAPYREAMRAIPRSEMMAARLGRSPRVLESLVTMLQTRLKEAQIAEAVEDPSIRVVDAAVIPIKPVRPDLPIDLTFGVFAGLMLGGAAAVLKDRRDRSVRSSDDVHWATGVPVIGVIPSAKGMRAGSAMLSAPARRLTQLVRYAGAGALDRGDGRIRMLRGRPDIREEFAIFSEAYARLQLNLAFSRGDVPVRTILFSSAAPGEGKTTSAVNFALTLAHRGHRTALVDADLRHGTIGDIFGDAGAPGLSDVLTGAATLSTAKRSIEIEPGCALDFFPTGSRTASPAQLLGSPRMREVLAQLVESYDRIVVDSPPLNVVTDAAILGTYVEGVVVVARAGRTDPDALGDAIEQLRRVHAPLLGTLLNDVELKRDRAYEASYRYHGHSDAVPHPS